MAVKLPVIYGIESQSIFLTLHDVNTEYMKRYDKPLDVVLIIDH